VTTDIAVRVEDVSKSFNGRVVLDRLSFDVLRGTAFCILGRSGTGKSVALKHIIRLMKPDTGRIYVEGNDITEMDSSELTQVRKKIGFLFQNSALFDSITVGENVAFPIRRHLRASEAELREQALQKLSLVGLENEYNKMPSDLSGGMRKRAALARALAMNPSILLIDEPSSGLDPITSSEIDQLLLSLKQSQKVTIILVTHNIPSARTIADELIMLDQGRIIARGTVGEMEKSKNEMVRLFMRSRGGG
jgi:phospholipid/cholesterol/gamma-HCH transport system ATP-binding protein